jgi:hypothetical protein
MVHFAPWVLGLGGVLLLGLRRLEAGSGRCLGASLGFLAGGGTTLFLTALVAIRAPWRAPESLGILSAALLVGAAIPWLGMRPEARRQAPLGLVLATTLALRVAGDLTATACWRSSASPAR